MILFLKISFVFVCKINKIIDVNQKKSTFLFQKTTQTFANFGSAILRYLCDMCVKYKLCICEYFDHLQFLQKA